MSSKKALVTVTASAAIASALFMANETEAASHKVQPGDTLWAIAKKYNTNISQLKAINGLSSDIIYPNQVLETSGTSKNIATSSSTKQNIDTKSTSTTNYIVQKGDTLSGIAVKHKVSLSNLMKWNNLSSSLIFPGNVLVIHSSGATTTTEKNTETQNTNSKNPSQTNSSTSEGSSTSTYTIKSGDTLSGIAFKFKVSIKDLMKWNNLDTTLIYAGHQLKLNGVTVPNDSKKEQDKKNTSSNESSTQSTTNSTNTVYTVKAGDTLSKIGKQFGVSVTDLRNWNKLSSNLIYVGQKLNIQANNTAGGTSSAKNTSSLSPTSNGSYNVNKLLSVAKSLSGIPYVWGGASPKGFDCSGFIYYVYKQAGMDIKRYSSEGYYDRSYYVSKPQLGDLVFFANTYKKGISHVGIYVGNNSFINAGNKGVTIVSLDNSYWKKHFDSFKRFY